jgi:hypothetical protein
MDDPRRPAHLNLIDDYGEVLGYAVGVRRQFQFNVALN